MSQRLQQIKVGFPEMGRRWMDMQGGGGTSQVWKTRSQLAEPACDPGRHNPMPGWG